MVIGLAKDNIIRGLNALIDAGYALSIPVTPEEFADENRRNVWRERKNMVVLKLWSDAHRRTLIDVFVYEPFDFSREYQQVLWAELAPDLHIPILRYETLIRMKQDAGRPQDLIDIESLETLRRMRVNESGEKES